MIYLVIFAAVTIVSYFLLRKSFTAKHSINRKVTITQAELDQITAQIMAEEFPEIELVAEDRIFRRPAPPVTKAAISLSQSDDRFGDWQSELVPHPNRSLKGQVIHFEYVNGKDEYSSRRVRVGSIGSRRGRYYLNGYCFEREAARCFRLDRMGETACLGTGEIFVSGLKWLKSFDLGDVGTDGVITNDPICPKPETSIPSEPVRYFEAGATVLMYLSHFDGKVTRDEKKLIATFIAAVQGDIDSVMLARFVREALGWFPTADMTEAAFAALAEQSSEIRAAFHCGCQQFFAVSGPVSESKRAEWKRLEGRLTDVIG